MGSRFTGRRTVIAAAALTLTLGSGAYAALSLPSAPDPVESTLAKVLGAVASVAGRVVGPPSNHDKSDPKLAVPGTDALPLPGLLGGKPAAAAKGPRPAKAGAKKDALLPVPEIGGLLEPVSGITGELDPAPDKGEEPKSDADIGDALGDVFGGDLISTGPIQHGENWNFCNNNNYKEIVNHDSNGAHNEVAQNNNGSTESGDLDCK